MRCLDVRWFWCQVIHELIVSSPHDVHRTAKLSKLAQKLGQLVNFEGPRQTTLMQRLLQDVLIYFALLLGKKYTCYSDRSAHMIQCAQNCTYVYNLYFFCTYPLHFLRRELLLRVADHRKGCTRQSRNSNCAGSAWIALNSVAGILKTMGCSLQGTFVCSLLLIDVSN